MFASEETYASHAELTVGTWLPAAVRSIDDVFGKGYAQANPGLLGAYLQACAIEHLAARGVNHLSTSIDLLAGSKGAKKKASSPQSPRFRAE